MNKIEKQALKKSNKVKSLSNVSNGPYDQIS